MDIADMIHREVARRCTARKAHAATRRCRSLTAHLPPRVCLHFFRATRVRHAGQPRSSALLPPATSAHAPAAGEKDKDAARAQREEWRRSDRCSYARYSLFHYRQTLPAILIAAMP